MSGRARAAGIDEEVGGSVPAGPFYRLWLYSGDESGCRFAPPSDNHIPCRDDGHLYHAAHRELPSVDSIDPVDRLIRDAGLGMLEAQVFRRQRQGVESNGAIAEALGITSDQLRRAVTSARRKLRALRERQA